VFTVFAMLARSDGKFKPCLLESIQAVKLNCISHDRVLQPIRVDALRSGLRIANAGHGGVHRLAIGRVAIGHWIDYAGCRFALLISQVGTGGLIL